MCQMKRYVGGAVMGMVVLAVLATGRPVQAVKITNNGTTVFFDNFESASDPTGYGWNEQNTDPCKQTDSDPDGANPGAWQELLEDGARPHDIQVTYCDYDPDGGAVEGSNLLRIYRAGGGAATAATFPKQTSGDLHAEFMIRTTSEEGGAHLGNMIFGFSGDLTDEGWVGARMWIYVTGSLDVWTYSGSWQDTGLDLTADTWQKVEIDYTIGASTFDLTIDDINASGLPLKEAGDVLALVFRGAAQGGKCFVDAIGGGEPEPPAAPGLSVLFHDDFESASDPSPYSWERQQQDLVPRTDSDPDGASPGTWEVHDVSNYWDIQATNAAPQGYDPGAYQGAGYFRIRRPGGGAYAFADFAPATSGSVHAEWVYFTDAGNVNYGTIVNLSGGHADEGWSLSRVTLATQTDGSIKYYAGGWQMVPGVTYTVGAWQKWEIDYEIGANTFVLTVDGVSSGPLSAKSAGSVSTLAFRGGATDGKGWFDNVLVSGYRPLEVDDYTQGLWHFDDPCNYDDVGGMVNNVMSLGGSGSDFVAGRPGLGQALRLGDTGLNGYATVADDAELENTLNDCTVEGWVLVDPCFAGGYLRFVSKYNTTPAGERAFDSSLVYDSALATEDQFGDGKIHLVVRVNNIGRDIPELSRVAQTPIPTGSWTHVAVVLQDGRLRIFINGAESETKAVYGSYLSKTTGYADTDTQWNIGRYEGQDGHPGYLTVDELRISKIARYGEPECEPQASCRKAPLPFYYGAHWARPVSWQDRVITEFSNIVIVSGAFMDYTYKTAWQLRSRGQRVMFDLMDLYVDEDFSIHLMEPSETWTDEEALAALSLRRAWLEDTGLIDNVDMLYVFDEPYNTRPDTMTEAHLNRVCNLVAEVFPEIPQIGSFTPAVAGHNMPDKLDYSLMFFLYYDYKDGGPENPPSYASRKQDLHNAVAALRAAGVDLPLLIQGGVVDTDEANCTYEPGVDCKRMPTPQEILELHQMVHELNAEDPDFNAFGIAWWKLETVGDWIGLADNYFTTYAAQVAAQRQIGLDNDYVTNDYRFVDMFETEPSVGDGYTDGVSINGINGWVCDYQDTDGTWHYGEGADVVSTGAAIDGLRVARVWGRSEGEHPVSPPADQVVFKSGSLDLAGTTERYTALDIVGRLGSSTGDQSSTVVISTATADPIDL